ncbi:hypothetical protein Pmar_PMAR023040 [Perkinsus marinus ATCC 50983]|uniref:DUF4708 domain-containing protein n=1 Tax=Perkinsus marinus (strain ATCC 50983 / TXsc) TaxID=423536 RepID=C5LHY8_PERM5|nr:hypothetical protein Pmar_PMAR023040 [Perkinsus marinus ATCC 50983]EER03742.1 hypothetical protein Pmar_PMAR023040 [Perkinsus marinus ATCC 50983]|eukprot:XP_002771926.1 hypothetical protein Pmar_PMAR023040 [Perkinsus marinus ATCC 50983]
MRISPATFRVVKPDVSSMNPVELLHPRCVLLPHMSEAVIVGLGPAPNPPPGLKSKEDLIRYWRYLHGYELPEDAVERTIQVQFPRGSLVLTYPLGCAWATPWTYLPTKTGQFAAKLNREVIEAIREILGDWSKESGLVVELHEDPGAQPESDVSKALPKRASEIPRDEGLLVQEAGVWKGLPVDEQLDSSSPVEDKGQPIRGRPQRKRRR